MRLLRELDSHWSRILGLPIIKLRKGETRLVSIDKQIEIPPSWLLIAMKIKESCVIPIVQNKLNEANNVLREISVEQVFTDVGIKRIQTFHGTQPNRIAHWLHSFCDEENFKAYGKHKARRLEPYGSDREMCRKWCLKFPRAISPYSYELLDYESKPKSYGIIVNKELASVAVVWRYELPFWEIGVETNPDYRRRGYAKSVVSLATEEVLAARKIPWYYLDAVPLNEASLRVCKAVGYVEYSESLNYKLNA